MDSIESMPRPIPLSPLITCMPIPTTGQPRPQTLHLSNCVRLSDEALRAVGDGCPKLKKFHCSNLPRMKDGALLYLATKCPLLEELTVGFNTRLTDTSISQLPDMLPGLKLLEVGKVRVALWHSISLSKAQADISRYRACPSSR